MFISFQFPLLWCYSLYSSTFLQGVGILLYIKYCLPLYYGLIVHHFTFFFFFGPQLYFLMILSFFSQIKWQLIQIIDQ